MLKNIPNCTPHTEDFVWNHLPPSIDQKKYHSSINTHKLLESSPYPIPKGPPRMGEEVQVFGATNSGQVFNSTSFCGDLTPLMQIPGLLKASHVPLCRLNREGIME